MCAEIHPKKPYQEAEIFTYLEDPDIWLSCVTVISKGIHLELQTASFLWLFQLDDSKSLHKKWLFHQTSIKTMVV